MESFDDRKLDDEAGIMVGAATNDNDDKRKLDETCDLGCEECCEKDGHYFCCGGHP